MALVSYGRYRPTQAACTITGTLDTAVYRDGDEILVTVDYEYTPGAPNYDNCPAYDASVWLDVVEPVGLVLTPNERACIEEQVCEAVSE